MADWPYNTQRWKRLRAMKLAVDPLCRMCAEAKITTAANTVDHVKPISDGGEPFPPLDELDSLCASHHSQKTARGTEAGAIRSTRDYQPRKGCRADGSPTDPTHPWAN